MPAPASLSAIPLSLSAIPLIPSTAVAATSSFQPVYSGTLAPTLPPITTYGAVPSVGSADPKPKAVPFKVASSIVPIPAKLVKRIQALEFVDMRELLPDNIALAERLAALPPGLAPPKPPGEREIRGDRALVTWLSSFATYVAIVAQAHPERVGDMLAYMRLIAREASKFGGTGWLTYDAVFRRNREGSSAPWNVIDASLHQVYVANQQEKVAVPCKHCQEVDHSDAECAVAAILPKPLSPPAGSLPSQRADRSTMGKGKRPAPYSRQRPVCTSWNAGNCRFPGKCAYAHVCANCYGSHPAVACRDRTLPVATPTNPAK